jgi:hypothetical protein
MYSVTVVGLLLVVRHHLMSLRDKTHMNKSLIVYQRPPESAVEFD